VALIFGKASPKLERWEEKVKKLGRLVPLIGLALLVLGCKSESGYQPASGDIVFQTSRSDQSRAIQLATNSPYSHVGIVYVQEGTPRVFEAVDPVKLTPLDEWIGRGENEMFVAKRLRNATSVLTPEAVNKMRETGAVFMGKNYDKYFEWSNDRIYCSELVWKVFEGALGIELGRVEQLGDFDLSSPEVQALLKERWPAGPPEAEPVVSPVAIFESAELVEVYRQEAP
jgi:hypothetical protein